MGVACDRASVVCVSLQFGTLDVGGGRPPHVVDIPLDVTVGDKERSRICQKRVLIAVKADTLQVKVASIGVDCLSLGAVVGGHVVDRKILQGDIGRHHIHHWARCRARIDVIVVDERNHRIGPALTLNGDIR